MEKQVSIIIPCRNEADFIRRCLDSLLNNNYPNLEILVIDGDSQDKTKEIVKDYIGKFPFIKLLNNPKRITPIALNIGINSSKGEIIIRADAHATYSKDYVSKCVYYLDKYSVDNVGGVIKTIPLNNKIVSKAIALSLSSVFGSAGSSFRTGAGKPELVDTVFGGCYRRDIFKRFGFFNEKLVRSQDLEFNLRLKKNGGKILLVPDIVSHYYPKTSLWGFLKHNIQDGVWSIYPLKFISMNFSLRHYIPLIFVSFLIIFAFFSKPIFWIILGSYILLSLYFSSKISFKEKDLRYLFLMPLVFSIRHIGYGLGSILGIIKLI